MKLYLLDNGVSLKIMAIAGPSVTPAEFIRASAKLREFFSHGTCEVIAEVNIRPEAVETIGAAIVAFDPAAVPLHSAISELLNFCQSRTGRGIPFTGLTSLPGSQSLLNGPSQSV